jgi:hypothetical protein
MVCLRYFLSLRGGRKPDAAISLLMWRLLTLPGTRRFVRNDVIFWFVIRIKIPCTRAGEVLINRSSVDRSTSFARALWKSNKAGDLACSQREPTVARQRRTLTGFAIKPSLPGERYLTCDRLIKCNVLIIRPFQCSGYVIFDMFTIVFAL